jgi:superfamily II DNA/RNA helicase
MDMMPASNTDEGDIGAGAGGAMGGQFRQTTMFSATMPAEVESLARKYLVRLAANY